MRLYLLTLPLMLAAAPALAAPPAADRTIPPEMSDPAMADKLTRMATVLTRSLMDMPVGELEAAFEGRTPTEADKRRRVRDEVGPEGEKQIAAEVAASGPRMRAMQKALVSSLPAIMGALQGVERELERAVANIPDPTYPQR